VSRVTQSFCQRIQARSLLVALCLLAAGATTIAQGRGDVYKARLSPLGVTGQTVNTTTGVGNVTATLVGNQLAIEGSFEGLTGNATAANLRTGPKGIPGPVIVEVDVPKAPRGAIKVSVPLTASQVEDLRAGRLYLQIHSERAPDGSIRGWLLK
jgi:hypothetical protein